MRWGNDEVGVVLTRNEIWLLLNALAAGPLPSVGWDGTDVEPWVVGELRARLQAALDPDSVSDVEQRPIIRLDSDMGRSLAIAGIKPMVIPDGYDLGTLFAACAERGWGAELRLPLGASAQTPADAVVRAKRVDEDGQERSAEYVGVERPVVALTRAVLGALIGEPEPAAEESGIPTKVGPGAPGSSSSREPRLSRDVPEATYEEHVIFADALPPREKEPTIAQMARTGWELVADEGPHQGGRLVFRRPRSSKG